MPVYIARNAAARGVEVFVVGIKGNASAADYPSARVFEPLRLGQMGACIRFFKNHGVTQVIMAGRVKHTSIFSNLMPDLRTASALAR